MLRIWKLDVMESKILTLANDFISSQTYMCIEINLLMLVVLYRSLRDSGTLNLFNFLKFLGSQACEELFRKLRAMTTIYWTNINFSVQEVLQKLRRINVLQQIEHELHEFCKYFKETLKT